MNTLLPQDRSVRFILANDLHDNTSQTAESLLKELQETEITASSIPNQLINHINSACKQGWSHINEQITQVNSNTVPNHLLESNSTTTELCYAKNAVVTTIQGATKYLNAHVINIADPNSRPIDSFDNIFNASSSDLEQNSRSYLIGAYPSSIDFQIAALRRALDNSKPVSHIVQFVNTGSQRQDSNFARTLENIKAGMQKINGFKINSITQLAHPNKQSNTTTYRALLSK